MARARSVGLCVVFTALLFSNPGSASEPAVRYRVAVFAKALRPPHESHPTEIWLSEQVRDQAGFFPSLNVLSASEFAESSQDRGLTDAVRACENSSPCIRARLERTSLDLAIVLVANTQIEPALVTGTIFDLREPTSTRSLLFQTKAERLEPMLRASVIKGLEACSLTVGARIWIQASPAEAVVSIDKFPQSPSASGMFVLAPGTYVARVALDGYTEGRVDLLASPGKTSRIDVQLQPESASVWWRSPWIWAVAGTVVAAGVTGAVLVTQSQAVIQPVYGGSQ